MRFKVLAVKISMTAFIEGNVPASRRYGDPAVTLIEAVEAQHAALAICSGIANLGALGFLKDFGDNIAETRRKIQKSAGVDRVSGEPYSLADREQKLADYPLKKRLYWLLGLFVIQMLFTIVYLIFKDVHVLSESNSYAIFHLVANIFRVLPTLLSAILFLRLAVLRDTDALPFCEQLGVDKLRTPSSTKRRGGLR